MKLLRIILVLTVTATVLLSSCRRASTPADQAIKDKTLLLGNGSEPQDLDPQVCTALADYNILISLFEGLTCIDEKTSQAVPGVADTWSCSSDGRIYTLYIQ